MMKRSIVSFSFQLQILWSWVLVARAACHDINEPAKLWFRADGKFKIVVFADLHYGENAWEDWGPVQDQNTNKVLSSILDAENPDFVVYLGDLVTANNVPVKNASSYWRQALEPTRSRGIPWASVFGNHDDMAFEWPAEWFGASGVPGLSGVPGYFEGTTRADLMNEELRNLLSLSETGPQSLWPSVSNFAVKIGSCRKSSTSSAAILYFLDSGGGSYPEVISANQAAWFSKTASQLNPNNKTAELIFWHIPSKAYEAVAPKPRTPITPPCIGSINKEEVASQTAEWGIMDNLTKRSSAKVLVVGHNHGLDWCCPYKSLWLCFARHTGYGGYGSWIRGARVIELTESPEQATTWIRLEDGSVLNTHRVDQNLNQYQNRAA